MRVCILSTLLCLLPQTALAEPPTIADAKRALSYPSGTLSLGFTNSGTLRNGEALPPAGPGYRIFPSFVPRKTNFGTSELIGLIKRVGAKLESKYPDAVMGVGNLTREGGGQTGSSVSHKTGRDVDLGMFALTKAGRAKNLGSFVAFEKDGWDAQKRYRFDPARNLDLVLAILEDKKTFVQVIFVADWLKAVLLKEAQARGVSAALIARLDTVLRQPSDSNPHHHHYHVRTYCSVQDRLHGCLERGDVHPWVEHGEKPFQRRIKRLIGLLNIASETWRMAVIRRLGEMRAASAMDALLKHSEDPSVKVSLAALSALGELADPDAYGPLEARLERTHDAKRITGLLRALLRLELPELEKTALDFLRRLDSDAYEGNEKTRRALRIEALGILQRFGRRSSLQTVLGYLDPSNPKLFAAVHKTLRRITNQPIQGRMKSVKQRRKVQKRWQTFSEEHQNKSWVDWMKIGFTERGPSFSPNLNLEGQQRHLIKRLTDRDEDAAHNAALLLMHQTGHVAYPWWRKKRNNRRHWETWFRKKTMEETTR